MSKKNQLLLLGAAMVVVIALWLGLRRGKTEADDLDPVGKSDGEMSRRW